MKQYSFDIDVMGACNLRCPACAQGNIDGYHPQRGPMEPELLRKIVDKAKSECKVTRIQLFVWGEPLLHPRLPELVRIVQEAGIPCHLSSNLNVLPDADALMATDPASFKISISGFTQKTYEMTHRGGDIEQVKKNLLELAAAKVRNRAKTRIYAGFHRYRHNLKEEPRLRDLLQQAGVGFEGSWAQLLPLEKVLRFDGEDSFSFPLTHEDHELVESLALPLGAALELCRKQNNRFCPLRESQLSIDPQGNVQLCCAVFDARQMTIGHFLERPIQDIQKARLNHPVCDICMQHGAHLYMTCGIPQLDQLALENVDPGDIGRLGLRREFAISRLKAMLTRHYRNLPLVASPAREAALASGLNRTLQAASKLGRALSGKR